MVAKIWQIAPQIEDGFLVSNPGYSRVLLQLLFNRGLKANSEIADFLQVDIGPEDYFKKYDPFLFRDMAVAVDLIISHIKAGHKIMIYGDYDADGVTSTVVLAETLRILKAQVDYYLPDRVSEGYGLNTKAIEQIAAQDFKLIITVDTGTRNINEIKFAQARGVEVIVTDHHVLPDDPEEIPPCLLINCADQNNDYPFKYLAGVGVAFKLVEALLSKAKLTTEQKRLLLEKNLDLVALGTVSDMVKLLGENRWLVKRGLVVLNKTSRLGLQALIKSAKINPPLDAWNIGFQLGPRLNAASRIEHANTALELLTTKDQAVAERLASDLSQKNSGRQKITEEIMAEVEKQIDPNNLQPVIVGVCDFNYDTWNEGVIGLVAGRITEKYYRPTLIITHTQEGLKGSGRSIEEFNLVEAITSGGDFLEKYGGHPMACGFSVANREKLDQFINYLEKYAAEKLAGIQLLPKLKIDCELDLNQVDLDLVNDINRLAPFGQNNPQPKFVSYGLAISDITRMGNDSQHIKIRCGRFWALAFGKGDEYQYLQIGDKIDLVYYLEVNSFNGRSEVQLKIVDLKKLD